MRVDRHEKLEEPYGGPLILLTSDLPVRLENKYFDNNITMKIFDIFRPQFISSIVKSYPYLF